MYGIHKNGTHEPSLVENGLVNTVGEGEGGINWESNTDIYHV